MPFDLALASFPAGLAEAVPPAASVVPILALAWAGMAGVAERGDVDQAPAVTHELGRELPGAARLSPARPSA